VTLPSEPRIFKFLIASLAQQNARLCQSGLIPVIRISGANFIISRFSHDYPLGLKILLQKVSILIWEKIGMQ